MRPSGDKFFEQIPIIELDSFNPKPFQCLGPLFAVFPRQRLKVGTSKQMAFQNSDKPDHPIIFTQMRQGPIQLLAYILLYLLILAIRMPTSKRCEISFPSLVRQNKKTSLDFAEKSN